MVYYERRWQWDAGFKMQFIIMVYIFITSRKVQNFLKSLKFQPPARDMQKLRKKTNESAYYSTAVMSAIALKRA